MNILEEISNARQSALNESYNESLSHYRNAREDIEREIANCHDPQQNKNWTNMIHEIDAEMKAVKNIIASSEAFFTKLDTEPPPPKVPDFNEDDSVLEPPVQVVKPAQRPVVGGGGGRKPAAVNRNANIKPAPSAGRVQPSRQPISNRGGVNANRNDRNKPSSSVDPKKPMPPKEAGKDQKQQELDPSTNPLVQQIVDMGILIREPDVSWDSIAGLNDVKKLLRKQLVLLPLRPDLCKGLLSPWKSVLLYGPPGTGKTFLAKAVATECKRTFFNVTSATITSRFHGESEKLVSFLFQLAEQMAPATIFFDEIDSVASQRGTSNEGEASRRMKAQLLTNIEGIGSSGSNSVFVLAATNFPWDLDEALLRRFQKRVYIPLPDLVGRRAILEMRIKEYADETFDYDGWAKKLEGYSCADITNLCRDAAQMVFDRQTDLLDTQQWIEMPTIDARIIIKNEDFAKAVALRKSSVDQASLAKYEAWRKAKGAE
ncbi:ATPase, AAA family protein [Tritrichomonas foetus]|uniref:ATPase, AAA family protein n=1 Tax=Tritrichomonas foetus TaxID=1144522 RepID=A0A1J4JYH4_9EUKA|nr:ATPase, AAA family protein [Tritrichomonas foetus]|eukprot:OHT04209.1 ATPase, AAA family protein [Tritrichomonas foetus]